jgi:FkbM family methyltransferase
VRALLGRLRRGRPEPAQPAPERAGQRLLEAFAERHPGGFFIEIGSNDGVHSDHLRSLLGSGGWRGLMVEPVPYVFERLRENYGGVEGIALENAAIADRDGRLPFFHLAKLNDGREGDLPSWYDQIGSFSRETILGHADKIPDIERRLVRTEVPSLTFESLCRKHGVERVDLLLTDTEGYDWEIIKRIDFDRRHPGLLIYEHYHLPAKLRAECREFLEARGYALMEEGFDTWCLDRNADEGLTLLMGRLEPAVPSYSADERPA